MEHARAGGRRLFRRGYGPFDFLSAFLGAFDVAQVHLDAHFPDLHFHTFLPDLQHAAVGFQVADVNAVAHAQRPRRLAGVIGLIQRLGYFFFQAADVLLQGFFRLDRRAAFLAGLAFERCGGGC